MSNYFWVQYVKIKDIPSFESVGWRVRDTKAPSHHCFYGKIMKWEGDSDEPKYPVTTCTETEISY